MQQGATEHVSGDWRDFRRLMPVAEKLAYFDHAAVAPLPGPARDAVASWAEQAAEKGDTVYSRWLDTVERARSVAAAMIGATPQEIAFLANTTAGVNLVAEGFPWRAGDNVVTLANEFPTNLYPWMNLAGRGVETRRLPVSGAAVDLNRIAEACDRRTRIVSVSWVGYASGWRIDIGGLVHLAHQRGILVFLDAIQGLGVFPLDVGDTPIDFLAADGHKWMLGPEGAGLFFVRRQHLDLLRPLNVGWNSVVHARDFSRIELNFRREASRYEGGSPNMAGLAALGASLELLVRFGLSAGKSPLAERVLAVTDILCERLGGIGAKIFSDRNGENRSGIVSFELGGSDAAALQRRCLAAGVVLSCREGRLRVSPHVYTNDDDIERLIAALR